MRVQRPAATPSGRQARRLGRGRCGGHRRPAGFPDPKARARPPWGYHNAPYRLIHDVIADASSLTINQFTKTRVLDRTGMKGLWIDHIMYGKARDMARFGLLMQAGGVWDGDTLLHDQSYFQDMIHSSQDLNKSYGYLWWLNGQASFMLPGLQFVFPGKLISNAPDDMYSALGKNDQKIHIVPSKGWVVVRQGNAAGYVGPGGNEVPIAFDNAMWSYLNQLVCVPTSVSEAIDNQIKIFPNPAADGWQIESTEAIEQIEIFDLQGKMLRTSLYSPGDFESPGELARWLDATGLPEGVFVLKVLAGGKTVWTKVVKVR